MANDDNRVTIRLDESEAADVAAAMRFRGIRNRSDFLRQAIAAEVRRTRREMQSENIGHVAEDQAPYGAKPSTPPAQFSARPPLAAESPALQALEAGLPEAIAAVEARARAEAAKAAIRAETAKAAQR